MTLYDYVQLFWRESQWVVRAFFACMVGWGLLFWISWWMVPPRPQASLLLLVSVGQKERTLAQLNSHAWASRGARITAEPFGGLIRVRVTAEGTDLALEAARALLSQLERSRASERNAALVLWAQEVPRDDRLKEHAEALRVEVIDPVRVEQSTRRLFPLVWVWWAWLASVLGSTLSVLVREWWQLETKKRSAGGHH